MQQHRTDDSYAAHVTTMMRALFCFGSSSNHFLELFAKRAFVLQKAVWSTICMLCNLLVSSMISLVSPDPPFFSPPKI